MTANTPTRAAQLTDPSAIDIPTIERESRCLFRIPDRYEVRQCADGSRVVIYDSAEVDDYADLEAEVVAVLQRYDEGAYGGSPADAAEDWIRRGYGPLSVDEWLSVGVCFPSHADALTTEGFAPDALRGIFTGWATDEAVCEYLDGPDAD